MKKTLLLFKTAFNNRIPFIWVALLLLLFTGVSIKSQAQLYYIQSDGQAGPGDRYNVAPYAGGASTVISTGQINSASRFAIDGNNNRLFAVESQGTTGVLKVLN